MANVVTKNGYTPAALFVRHLAIGAVFSFTNDTENFYMRINNRPDGLIQALALKTGIAFLPNLSVPIRIETEVVIKAE